MSLRDKETQIAEFVGRLTATIQKSTYPGLSTDAERKARCTLVEKKARTTLTNVRGLKIPTYAQLSEVGTPDEVVAAIAQQNWACFAEGDWHEILARTDTGTHAGIHLCDAAIIERKIEEAVLPIQERRVKDAKSRITPREYEEATQFVAMKFAGRGRYTPAGADDAAKIVDVRKFARFLLNPESGKIPQEHIDGMERNKVLTFTPHGKATFTSKALKVAVESLFPVVKASQLPVPAEVKDQFGVVKPRVQMSERSKRAHRYNQLFTAVEQTMVDTGVWKIDDAKKAELQKKHDEQIAHAQ